VRFREEATSEKIPAHGVGSAVSVSFYCYINVESVDSICRDSADA